MIDPFTLLSPFRWLPERPRALRSWPSLRLAPRSPSQPSRRLSRARFAALALALVFVAPLAAGQPHGVAPSAATGSVPVAPSASSNNAVRSTPGPVDPAGPNPHAVAPVNPHGPNPHANLLGQGAAQAPMQLLSGSPFASAQHRRQAELTRGGRSFHPANATVAEPQLPPGSIGIIVRDGDRKPIAGQKLVLRVVKESIEQGNSESELETTTNEQGYAAFLQQPTTSHYRFEVIARSGGAKYSSGPFNLDERQGKLVTLHVYPTTENLSDVFLFSRALYVVQPRDDVFDVQGLFRFENTNPVTWIAKDLVVDLPPGAKAFRAGNPSGDLRAIEEDSSMHIRGTFSPGQHELTFSYQLDNPGNPTAQLRLPVPPQMVDVKAILEASKTMTFSVAGLGAPKETRGQDGQRALMVVADYLGAGTPPPASLQATITGLPERGWGALVAAIIAGAIALLGVAFAVTHDTTDAERLPEQDRNQARDLLLDELLLVERAFEQQQIGPKTYEQTRRQLVDALARLELAIDSQGSRTAS